MQKWTSLQGGQVHHTDAAAGAAAVICFENFTYCSIDITVNLLIVNTLFQVYHLFFNAFCIANLCVHRRRLLIKI